MFRFFVWSVLFLSPAIHAQDTKPLSKATYIMCRNGDIVRTVRIESTDEGCRAIYTKEGVDRQVGGGRNVITCTYILNNIKNNLEGAGWRCRDISSAQVTDGP